MPHSELNKEKMVKKSSILDQNVSEEAWNIKKLKVIWLVFLLVSPAVLFVLTTARLQRAAS